MASFNSSGFPVSSIVAKLPHHHHPPSSADHLSDFHHLSPADHPPPKSKRHRTDIAYANKLHPPTPSLLTTACFDGDDSTSCGPSLPVTCRAERTGLGIEVEQWLSDSESEELEMENYHASPSDDEELGVPAIDRRKAKHIRRGIRYRAGDETEEALIHGEDPDEEVTKEVKKEADGIVFRDLATNLILIGLWYDSPPPLQESRTYNGWSSGIFSRC
jgi:hypothetical protein